MASLPTTTQPLGLHMQTTHPRDLVTSLINSLRHPDTNSPPLTPTSNPLLQATPNIRKTLLTLHVLFPHELLPALDLLDRNLLTRLHLTTTQNDTQQATIPTARNLPGPLPGAHLDLGTQTSIGNLGSIPGFPPKASTTGVDAAEIPQVEIPTASAGSEIQPLSYRKRVEGQDPSLDHERSPPGNPSVAAHPRHADAYLVRSGQLPSRVRASGVREGTEKMTTTTCYEVRLKAWSCSCPAFAFAAFPAAGGGDGGEVRASDQQRRVAVDKGWRFGGLTIGSDMPVCKHLLACVLAEYGEILTGLVEEREVSEEELAGWAAGWGD